MRLNSKVFSLFLVLSSIGLSEPLAWDLKTTTSTPATGWTLYKPVIELQIPPQNICTIKVNTIQVASLPGNSAVVTVEKISLLPMVVGQQMFAVAMGPATNLTVMPNPNLVSTAPGGWRVIRPLHGVGYDLMVSCLLNGAPPPRQNVQTFKVSFYPNTRYNGVTSNLDGTNFTPPASAIGAAAAAYSVAPYELGD